MSLLRLICILALLMFLLAGCVYIPTDFHLPDSRKEIGDNYTDKIILGESTKEDVLLLLGEPDSVSSDGNTLRYNWRKSQGVILYYCGGYCGGAYDLPAEHTSLVITYDDKGLVESIEYEKSSLGIGRQRIPIKMGEVKGAQVPFAKLLENAQCGIVEAQELVAVSYRHGAEVDKDLVKAATWYTIAADNNSQYAASELDKLRSELTLKEYKEVEKVARTWRADSSGCQVSGDGVEASNH